MIASHPINMIRGAALCLRDKLIDRRILNLIVWPDSIIEAAQKQDAVNSEVSRECRELDTLLVEYAKDGVLTAGELRHLRAQLDEMISEIESGEVIRNGKGRIRMSRTRGVKPSKLAKTLGVHPCTVRRWIKANRIKAVSYGPKTTIIPHDVYSDIVRNGLPAEY